ncbi:dihydrodipicolinate reductase [Propionibacterium sp. oral taxon 192 str. F0372]|uniref:4-hydroxy-tetrahydrodipicolinate reductase n=1 Tax=Propionibacterium sp. oral taxon 192 TaxID=671222 RepID=UPI0003545F2D|nr:4-hydroxy-tetrahydrodipicolinate reductase [Propionibacterium sp. oral taxon 192]EPH00270.1 dihydrodipicolinate reductase [Propionibacterium sp. oral taxon 192 str. F0372]
MKIAVFGAKGRMGQEICLAIDAAADMELVAALDAGDDREAALGADVAIDFTHPDVVMDNISWCLSHGMHVVVGTTGMSEERIATVRSWLVAHPGVNALIASNFSIAAVLMMAFAAKAAPFFESAEIIELHHPGKADAPSGTAANTARMMAEARSQAGCPVMPDATTHETDGARGADVAGVHVHSVRLTGLFAHQEVVLGNPGEMLTIRDDGFQRSAYMPGILAGIRAVMERPGLTLGIEEILGI